MAVLSQIEPVWYEFNGKAGLDQQGRHIGILTQEMQRIAPYTVEKHIYKSKSGKEEYLSFDANALFYIIINAVKEQEQQMEQQMGQIEAQAAEIRSLRSELTAIKAQLQTILEQKELVYEETNRQTLVLEREAFLSQNQPNPFHRESLIKYFIPRRVNLAQLELTDESGRRITRLTISERGDGEVFLKANAYPAGTYFYTLILDGRAIETKKMILTY